MITPDTTDDPRLAALQGWLRAVLGTPPSRLEPASADASFRRYFRIWHEEATWIAMDAPPDKEDLQPYLHVAGVLAATGVNVPRVLERDLQQGFLLMTDLGSRQYLDALHGGADADALYADALAALLRIQLRGTRHAASLPAYDETRLRQEMALFPEWFVGRHLGLTLTDAERAMLESTFGLLARAATAQPQVLVHRDYHSRNLMVCDDNPGILDFQDAVVGAASYDLVSLLKDCYITWPRERVLGWVRDYLDAAARQGLPHPGGEAQFIRAFDLMGLQRHLKVLGIFARLWYRDGKPGYLADLPRVLDYALAVTSADTSLRDLGRFLHERVVPAFAPAQARGVARA
jgi:aminoglycoside/choline kinase family phosphotransferase